MIPSSLFLSICHTWFAHRVVLLCVSVHDILPSRGQQDVWPIQVVSTKAVQTHQYPGYDPVATRTVIEHSTAPVPPSHGTTCCSVSDASRRQQRPNKVLGSHKAWTEPQPCHLETATTRNIAATTGFLTSGSSPTRHEQSYGLLARTHVIVLPTINKLGSNTQHRVINDLPDVRLG